MRHSVSSQGLRQAQGERLKHHGAGSIGSLEFATQLAGAKLIVVAGHIEWGAIKGAADNAKLGNLTATLENIRPSLKKLNDKGPAKSPLVKRGFMG